MNVRWLLSGFLLGVLLLSAQPPEKSSKVKKTALHPATPRSRKTGKSVHRRKPAGPSYQLHPDPQRYQQIQQALSDRGYYKGTADGNWNDDSTDALKRFQTDQKLEPDGKINALTLKGLGLGAKHDGTSAGTVPLSAAQSGTTSQPEVPPITEAPPESQPQ